MHLLDDCLFLGRQDVRELVEVAVRRGELLRRFLYRCHWRGRCRYRCCRCHVSALLFGNERGAVVSSRASRWCNLALARSPERGSRGGSKGDAKATIAGDKVRGYSPPSFPKRRGL